MRIQESKSPFISKAQQKEGQEDIGRVNKNPRKPTKFRWNAAKRPPGSRTSSRQEIDEVCTELNGTGLPTKSASKSPIQNASWKQRTFHTAYEARGHKRTPSSAIPAVNQGKTVGGNRGT